MSGEARPSAGSIRAAIYGCRSPQASADLAAGRADPLTLWGRFTRRPQIWVDIPPGFALTTTRLIAEIMGRHSNLILVDEAGSVLDAVKRIPSSLNRVRVTLPHQPYAPPPAQRKLDLRSMSAASFAHEIADLDPAALLWQSLVARFSAVSPLLAQEAVFLCR